VAVDTMRTMPGAWMENDCSIRQVAPSGSGIEHSIFIESTSV
jgi:hypothetical protein